MAFDWSLKSMRKRNKETSDEMRKMEEQALSQQRDALYGTGETALGYDEIMKTLELAKDPAALADYIDNLPKDLGVFDFVNDQAKLWEQSQSKLEDLLKNLPEYKIPEVITQLQQNLSQYAEDIRGTYEGASDELKRTIEQGISQTIDTYATKLDDAVNLAKGYGQSGLADFSAAFDTAKQTSDNIITAAKEGNTAALKTYEDANAQLAAKETQTEEDFMGSQNEMLDIYRNMYRSDFGQKILEDKLGAQTAGQISRIKELGAGSGAALSEIAKVYSGQQETLRDLVVQTKQYKNQAARDLAGAQERSNSALATIRQNNMISQLNRAQMLGGAQESAANRLMGAYQTGGELTMGAQQNLGAQKMAYGQNIASLMSSNAGNLAEMQMAGTQLQGDAITQSANMRGQGIQSAANLMTTGATTLADYQDRAYTINQLTPWGAQADYYSNLMNQMNPYPSYMDIASDKASAALGYQIAANQSEQNRQQQNSQLVGGTIGSLIQALFGGSGSNSGSATNTGG